MRLARIGNISTTLRMILMGVVIWYCNRMREYSFSESVTLSVLRNLEVDLNLSLQVLRFLHVQNLPLLLQHPNVPTCIYSQRCDATAVHQGQRISSDSWDKLELVNVAIIPQEVVLSHPTTTRRSPF